MNNFRLEIVEDISEAKKWWDIFSTHTSIYDEWEIRNCFYLTQQNTISFYVGLIDNEPIGLLPLQFNTTKKYLEFFGGSYMEDNHIYCKPGYEKFKRFFYQNLTFSSNLQYIIDTDDFTTTLPLQTYKYIFSFDGINTFEDYLERCLQREARGKIRRKIKKIEPHITVQKNNFDDIDLLFAYNQERFKEKSAFSFDHNKKGYKDLLKLSFPVDVFTFVYQNKKVGVSLGVWHESTYVFFNQGSDLSGPKELRTFINYYNFNNAIKNKAKLFDTSVGDGGWKEHWRFTKIPTYKFENTIKQIKQ